MPGVQPVLVDVVVVALALEHEPARNVPGRALDVDYLVARADDAAAPYQRAQRRIEARERVLGGKGRREHPVDVARLVGDHGLGQALGLEREFVVGLELAAGETAEAAAAGIRDYQQQAAYRIVISGLRHSDSSGVYRI